MTGCSVGPYGARFARLAEARVVEKPRKPDAMRFASSNCPRMCARLDPSFCVSDEKPMFNSTESDPTKPPPGGNAGDALHGDDDSASDKGGLIMDRSTVDPSTGMPVTHARHSACNMACSLGCGNAFLYGEKCTERCALVCHDWADGPWQRFSCLSACSRGCEMGSWGWKDNDPTEEWY